MPDLSPVNISKRILVGRQTIVPFPVTTPPETLGDIEVKIIEYIPPAKAEVTANSLELEQRVKVQELPHHGMDYKTALSVAGDKIHVLVATPKALNRQRLLESPSERLVRKIAKWATRNEAQKCYIHYSLRGIIRHRGSALEIGTMLQT